MAFLAFWKFRLRSFCLASFRKAGSHREFATNPSRFALGITTSLPFVIGQVRTCSAARNPAGSFPWIPPTTNTVGPATRESVMYQGVSHWVPGASLPELYVATCACRLPEQQTSVIAKETANVRNAPLNRNWERNWHSRIMLVKPYRV